MIEYRTVDGATQSTEVFALTATDAVSLLNGSNARRAAELGLNPAHVLDSARLSITPQGLHRAAYRVARELVKGSDEGWIGVREAVDIARNTLRLPEDPYVPGAYPLEDGGTATDTAFRAILEATPEEIDAAGIGPEASVRAR